MSTQNGMKWTQQTWAKKNCVHVHTCTHIHADTIRTFIINSKVKRRVTRWKIILLIPPPRVSRHPGQYVIPTSWSSGSWEASLNWFFPCYVWNVLHSFSLVSAQILYSSQLIPNAVLVKCFLIFQPKAFLPSPMFLGTFHIFLMVSITCYHLLIVFTSFLPYWTIAFLYNSISFSKQLHFNFTLLPESILHICMV